MSLLDNKKFGHHPKAKYQSDINPQKYNNYLMNNDRIRNNPIPIELNLTNEKIDKNINVQPIERDMIQLLNYPLKNQSENMKKNSFSISSIPSEDIQNFKKKSSSSSSISSSNLSNSKNEKSEINENNLHSDRQLTTTNMNFNVENTENNNEDNLNSI